MFDGAAAALPAARILHVGAPGLHPLMDAPTADGNGWSALLRRARSAGLHTNMELVSLAPDRLAEVALPCLPHLSSIVVNELEAGALTGIDAPVPGPDGPVDWEALAAMARGLVERGVGLAVVHFPAGSVAAVRGRRVARHGLGAPAAASRCAAPSARATRSPRACCSACTRAGPSRSACASPPRRPPPACRGQNTSDGIRPAADCRAADARRLRRWARPARRGVGTASV